jgi:FkbM family methyltransferase
VSNRVRPKVLGALPPRVHDSLRVAHIAALRGELPWHARAKLLMQAPRLLMSRARSDDLELVLPGGPVFIGRDSLYIDICTLHFVWNERGFRAACRDRVVLDLGAHKGYFGAWALKHGASFVLSCEPQSDNFRMLERARLHNARASDWEVMRIAVGAKAGEVSLFVSPESWAHSLNEEMVDAVSVEKVQMITLAALLERAREKRPVHSIVLKVNVEGSAGAILLPTTAVQLTPVVEVHLDHEPGSPYDLDELLRHLAAAGLNEVHNIGQTVRMVLRGRATRQMGADSRAP